MKAPPNSSVVVLIQARAIKAMVAIKLTQKGELSENIAPVLDVDVESARQYVMFFYAFREKVLMKETIQPTIAQGTNQNNNRRIRRGLHLKRLNGKRRRPGITAPIAAPAASGGKYVPPNRQPGKKGPPPTAASGEEDVPLWRRKLPSTPAESEIRWDKHKKKDPPEKCRVDNVSAIQIADCFFGVHGLSNTGSVPPTFSPESSPSPFAADGASQLSLTVPDTRHHSYHLSLVPGLGIAITAVAAMLVVLMVFLIRRKTRELDGHDMTSDKTSMKAISQPAKKFQEGPSCMFKKFTYRETKKATNNFGTVIGEGGFGTVFRAQFSDGSTLAVKRMNKVSDQAVEEFCREIELLARLHHRHLVALKGYCDHPLCHRDIKSSNILLDENFIGKVADFGLAYASKDGSICFEPVNTEIRGTPG
ncbi:probable receptor-like protein kinase isoform X1 [Tanacetum coccineum]